MCNYSDKFIYLSGGRSSNKPTNTVQRYNLGTEVWENVVKLNEKRDFHSSCALKEAVYVVGGQNEFGFISTMEKLEV